MKYLMQFSKLSDILDTNLDYDLIGEPSMLKFKDENEVILYAGLNKTNAELLKKGQLTDLLIAHEYSDVASKIKQSEVVVEISYNTTGLFDMLHPNAYKLVENFVKNKKIAKKELTDNLIVKEILSSGKYSGVRLNVVDTKKKLFTNTECIYEKSNIIYAILPRYVKVLNISK